jgi:pimeloyl-ACP methyl ester carboxylesterase
VIDRLAGEWQVLTWDRPGWGHSDPPDDYRRTSIAEQSIAAAGVLREHGVSQARVLGVGFGAVVALELALAEPGLVEGLVLIEPPLFDTLIPATEGMSNDVAAIREAAEEGGEDEVWRLYLAGRLTTLGAGAERLTGSPGAGPVAAHSLLVELPAVPAWPLDPVRIAGLSTSLIVATMPDTPALLVEAADALVTRVPGASRLHTAESGPAAVPELLREP